MAVLLLLQRKKKRKRKKKKKQNTTKIFSVHLNWQFEFPLNSGIIHDESHRDLKSQIAADVRLFHSRTTAGGSVEVQSNLSFYGPLSITDSLFGRRMTKIIHSDPYLYNTGTSVKRTIGSVPLVSVLKKFDCSLITTRFCNTRAK